jgi:serine/threonine-protein kinase HipA
MADPDQLFVWIHLPGSSEPELCGRASSTQGPAGRTGDFLYRRKYLERPDAIPVDPVRLPLTNTVQTTNLLFGHFSALLDAGPDRWGKRMIDRAFGPQTEYGYLRHVGDATTGALAFSGVDEEPWHAEPPRYESLEDLQEASRLIELNQPVQPELERLLRNGTGGGARPKTTVRHKDSLWIAKFKSIDDPAALPSNPKVEHATLLLARLAGVRTVEHELKLVGGQDVLLVKRFDRQPLEGGRWARSRYVSARTIFYSDESYARFSFSGSYPRLGQEFRRWVAAPAVDAAQLFGRMAFNCLASNTDDHDLNLGLLSDDGRSFRLAPAFDLVAGVHATRRLDLGMIVGEFGAAATRENLLSSAERFQLDRESAAAIIDQVETVVAAEWRRCFEAAGIGQADQAKYQQSFCPPGFRDPQPPVPRPAVTRRKR